MGLTVPSALEVAEERIRLALGLGDGWVGQAALLLVKYALAIAGVAGTAALIGGLTDFGVASTAMLLLAVVLASAVVLGRGPAIASSVLAFLALNWYFTEPRQTLFVADPEEWIILLVFLLAAFVTGQLAAVARLWSRQGLEQARLARVSQEVSNTVVDPDLPRALGAIARMLRSELDAAAVRITLNTIAPGDVSVLDSGDPQAATAVGERRPDQMVAQLSAHRGLRREPGWVRIVPPRRTQGPGRFRLARARLGGDDGEAGDIVLAFHRDSALGVSAARLVAVVADQLSSLVDRVRLRKRAFEAEVLRQSDEAKSSLIDAVSHDMRTPLASIIASAQTIQDPGVPWSDQERNAFAAAIEQEAQRLDRIVGNLLDLSRLRSGVIHPQKAWYEPVGLIREVLARMLPRVVAASHELVADLPDELPPLALDYSKFDQILTNLVENAARHTPPGTRIRVSAAVADRTLRVAVEDDGPGLDSRQLRDIFEPFYRTRGPAAGSGLGLSVARGLAESHGGRLWAERRRGGGTCFVFTIPGEGP